MNKYTTKALMLTLLTLWLAVLGISTGYALTFSEAQKLLANDGKPGDRFGWSASIYGDTAMIGALADDNDEESSGYDAGSVYVFVRDGAGVWREKQKLRFSNSAPFDNFGRSVSIFGDTAIIGAPGERDNGNRSGSAYVFVRDGAGMWRVQQKLTASDGAADDGFGYSVSIYGDTAVIGAWFDNDNGFQSGSAYVFVRDSMGLWREQQKLIASDGAAFDEFGHTVSISGGTAIIGAQLDNDNGFHSGSVYLFVRDGMGLWREHQKIIASDGAGGEEFGWSVSISGDTAVIGSRFDDDNGYRSGSAYVIARDGTGLWREQQKLIASDGAAEDLFGQSVSISEDKAVIGAILDDDKGSKTGSAYIFARDGAGVWSEQQKLKSSDIAAGDEFGSSVSIAGDTAMIGAHLDDDNGRASGSAYVFEVSDPNNNLLTLEKLINHRVRETPDKAVQLMTGTRYRSEYKVTNNRSDRLYNVQVFEDGELVCNLYELMPGQSKQPYRCGNNQHVLAGNNNNPASVTANVSGTNQVLSGRTNAYYTSQTRTGLNVRHYVNGKSANTQSHAVIVNGDQAEILFRVENTGRIELYRVNTFHDPASPVNSGWQQKCFIGTLEPGQVRYCKRTIDVTQAGLNKAFGRAQGANTNVGAPGYINASNPTYFNVVLP